MKALTAFAALGQETRLDVLRLLIRAGRTALQPESWEKLEVRQNTMSANLSILLNAGLIRNMREAVQSVISQISRASRVCWVS
ncbi:MAG: helix-turn-helix domain-containing protein [Nitratireductor sp.]